jgi:hypothetical protein
VLQAVIVKSLYTTCLCDQATKIMGSKLSSKMEEVMIGYSRQVLPMMHHCYVDQLHSYFLKRSVCFFYVC